jgi:N-acyl-D-aspartate/D-glutamate deacylase
MHDLIIKDARVVDGTGRPGYSADIAVDGGRISVIGRVGESGRRSIDAQGRVVAPGFIDIHTHYDAQGFWDSTLSPSPLHGVTTVFGGNCGFSVAPLSDASGEYLMRTLARVEGMPIESLKVGVPWDWRTTEEFLDRFDRCLAINAGFMVGHTALRRFVMGPDATTRRASEAEIVSMQALLRAGLRAGGIGFSSSWAPSHVDADGVPVPSRYADSHELIELARVCGEVGGTSIEFIPNHPDESLDGEVGDLLISMSAAARRPLNWNGMIVDAQNRTHFEGRLHASDVATAQGAKVVGLVLVEMEPMRYSVWGGFSLDQIPGWLDVTTGPLDQRLGVFRDRSGRERLFQAAAASTNPKPFIANWDTHTIAQTFSPPAKRYEGRRLGEIAAEEGKGAFDAFCDILLADDLRTYFVPDRRLPSQKDWEARAEIWRDPRAVIGASDAGAHLDIISTYNYTTSLLKKGVRDYRLLSLEEAVRLLTVVPAGLYGVAERGAVKEGYFADLVIFDESSVGPQPTRIVDDLPASACRLYGGSEGIGHVIVAGQEVVRDGAFTDARPGKVLRSGKDLVGTELAAS